MVFALLSTHTNTNLLRRVFPFSKPRECFRGVAPSRTQVDPKIGANGIGACFEKYVLFVFPVVCCVCLCTNRETQAQQPRIRVPPFSSKLTESRNRSCDFFLMGFCTKKHICSMIWATNRVPTLALPKPGHEQAKITKHMRLFPNRLVNPNNVASSFVSIDLFVFPVVCCVCVVYKQRDPGTSFQLKID